MAFTEIQDLDCETTTALGGRNKTTGKANPTQIEGYYIGSKNTPSRKSKNGVAKLHILQTPGGRVGVWGKTDLDRKMISASPGVMLRITQSGSIPTPNGDMYKFKVEFDKENSIEVNLPNAEEVPPASFSAADSNDGSSDEDDLDADDVSYDENPPTKTFAKAPAKAVAPSADRAAQLQALLSKSRTRV